MYLPTRGLSFSIGPRVRGPSVLLMTARGDPQRCRSDATRGCRLLEKPLDLDIFHALDRAFANATLRPSWRLRSEGQAQHSVSPTARHEGSAVDRDAVAATRRRRRLSSESGVGKE